MNGTHPVIPELWKAGRRLNDDVIIILVYRLVDDYSYSLALCSAW